MLCLGIAMLFILYQIFNTIMSGAKEKDNMWLEEIGNQMEINNLSKNLHKAL